MFQQASQSIPVLALSPYVIYFLGDRWCTKCCPFEHRDLLLHGSKSLIQTCCDLWHRISGMTQAMLHRNIKLLSAILNLFLDSLRHLHAEPSVLSLDLCGEPFFCLWKEWGRSSSRAALDWSGPALRPLAIVILWRPLGSTSSLVGSSGTD
jgi:hypothetical protein